MSLAKQNADGTLTRVGLWHGTIINVNGRRFKVTKLNPVNIKMLGEDGKSYNFNRNAAENYVDADQSWDGPKEKTEYDLYLERAGAGITLGTAVKLGERLAAKYGADTYVVIALPNDGKMRLAKLGGDGGRYLRGIVAADVEVVNLSQ